MKFLQNVKNKNKIILTISKIPSVLYENKISIYKISIKFFLDIELENWQLLHKHETIPWTCKMYKSILLYIELELYIPTN